MKHLKTFGQINEELDSTVDLFKQQFLEKYPTRGDFDRAFNEFCLSKECIDRFGGFPSGNMIDPMYDGHEEDKIRMMIEKEWEEIDPQNESGWREAIKKYWYLISLRNALPYKRPSSERLKEL